MNATNMSEFGVEYNGRPTDASHGTFVPPEADALPAAEDCFFERFDISPEAELIGTYLATLANPMNGEAVEKLEVVARNCGFDEDRVRDALDEMRLCGAVTFWRIYYRAGGDLFLHCEFEVDSDLYYGDDTNPPSDQYGDGGVMTDGVDWCYDRHVDEIVERVRKDPNPKRHRIFSKTKYFCFYCITERAEQIDHMHPRIRGGGNEDSNLIGACQPCNIRKKDRTVEEFRAYLAHKNRLPDISHVRFWGEAVN